MKWFKGVLYALFLGGCLVVGAGARLVANITGTLTDGEGGFIRVVKAKTDPRGEFPNRRELTILLVGQDYNRDRKGMPYTKNSRADTIMLIRADLEGRTVRACSVPRDTYVNAPDQVSGKINATLARGGIDLLKRTLESMFTISIDHYVVIKPYAVREIVDAIGGVDVEAIDRMKYDDNWGQLHVDLQPGRQHLDGVRAEGFVRFRHSNPGEGRSDEEGDIRRTARQQQLVQALMASANSPSNILRADEIIATGFQQIDTDLQKIQLFALAEIFKGSPSRTLQSATVPGEDDNSTGAYYYRLDTERAQAMVDWLIKGDDTAMRRLVRIEIRNGTKTPGLARLAAEALSGRGYSAKAPGNAPNSPITTIVYRKASFEEAARDIQRTLGAPSITKEVKVANEWEPEIQIVIGEDLKDKLKPSGTPTGT